MSRSQVGMCHAKCGTGFTHGLKKFVKKPSNVLSAISAGATIGSVLQPELAPVLLPLGSVSGIAGKFAKSAGYGVVLHAPRKRKRKVGSKKAPKRKAKKIKMVS